MIQVTWVLLHAHRRRTLWFKFAPIREEHSESSSAKNMDGSWREVHTWLSHCDCGSAQRGKRGNNASYMGAIVLSFVSFLVIVEGSKNIFAPPCTQVLKWEGTFAVTEIPCHLFFSFLICILILRGHCSFRKFCSIGSCRPTCKMFHLVSRSQVIVHLQ